MLVARLDDDDDDDDDDIYNHIFASVKMYYQLIK